MKKITAILLTICMILPMMISSVLVEAATPNAENAISWAIATANDNSHGYSWDGRWGPDYDCSSLVYTAYRNAGFKIGTSGSTTYSMVKDFTAYGEFEWITNINFANANQLKRGDILLNQSTHTEIYIGNNQMVGAHHGTVWQWCSHSNSDGKKHRHGHYSLGEQKGDQGDEISVQGYSNSSNWQGVLRPKYSSSNAPQGTVDNLIGGVDCIKVFGWAYDWDDINTSIKVHVYIGGAAGSEGAEFHEITADANSSDLVSNGIPGNHRFGVVVPTKKVGDQEVYLYAINIGGGGNVEIGHGKVHISASPVGTVDNVTGEKEHIKVFGWAYDWDNINTSIKVHVYIGGPAGSEGAELHEITADASSPDLVNNGIPGNHRFATNVQTSKSGKQEVYLYAINIGDGSNVEIGHKTVEILSINALAKENKGTISEGDYHIVSTDTKIGMGFEGNNVQLKENSTDDTQIMHVTNLGDGFYKITSKKSGLSIDVENASSQEGTNLQLCNDNGTSAQKWIIKEAEDGYNYYIISGCSGHAIDIENGEIKAGTNIRMWKWNKTDAQKWHFVRCNKDETQIVEDGNYRIISALDYKMGLNVEAANNGDGANINIYQNTEDKKQVFNISYIGDGFYRIVNTYTKTGLLTSASNPYKGNNVVANKDLDIKSMHWGIKKSQDGKYYNIYCQNGGNYLDVDGGVAENKRNVQLWSENFTAAQSWLLIPDEELEAKIEVNGLNASISWNTVSWADEYEVTIIKTEGENCIKKTVKSARYDVQLPAGQYSVSVTAMSNKFDYTKQSKSVEISMVKTKEDQVVNDIAFDGETFTYDGKKKSIVIQQKIPEGVTVEYEGNEKVSAGSYVVIARFFDENKTLLDVKKATMIIKPKEIQEDVRIVEISNQTYTGSEIVPEMQVSEDEVLLREGIDYTYECFDNINVGTATVTVKFIGNYQGEKNTTFSIIKAENEWTSELKCQDITYGENLEVFAISKFGNVEYKFSSTPLGEYKSKKPENVGSYYVKAFVDGTKNYNAIESEPVRFNIEKTEYDLSQIIFGNKEFTYDGEEKYLALTGKIPDGIEVQYVNNGKVNVGEYCVTAKLAGDDNHKECKDFTAKLIINPAYVQVPQGRIESYQEGEKIVGVEETAMFEVVSGGEATEVGKYQAIIKLKDSKNYRWSDGTTENKVVSWEIVESSQHKHKLKKVEEKQATCEEKGYEQYWKCQTCGELFVDEEGLCGIYTPIELPATGHQQIEIRHKKEATCEEDGYTGDEYCTKCKELLKKGETIFALDHAWNDGEIVKEASCIESGEKVYTCARCKKTKIDVIPAKGHTDTEKKREKEATCEENGYTGDECCKECGVALKKGQIIPALGHNWDEGTITKQPSTTEEGIRTYKCQRTGCQETRTEKIAKLPGPENPSTEPTTKPSTDETKPSKDNKIPATEAPKKNTGTTQKTLKVGTKITDKKSKAVYKVTGKKTVQYVKSTVKNVKTINIPATITANKVKYQVTSIAAKAVKGNKKLTKVVIPASIRNIGAQAFAGCKNLKNITIKTSYLTKKNVGAGAFKGISAKAVIKVPKKQLKAYQKMLISKGVNKKAKIKK